MLAAITIKRWGRIGFHVLDWNPARRFYEQLGLAQVDDWPRHGGDGTAPKRAAAEDGTAT
jgi:hypothetical protein